MTEGTGTTSGVSKKARARAHGHAAGASVVAPSASHDRGDDAVISEAYHASPSSNHSKEGKQPSLRLSEKVWTDRPISVDRGTATATTQTRDQGVWVCYEEEAFRDDATTGVKDHSLSGKQHSTASPPSATATATAVDAQLETIVDRLGPMLFQNLDTEAFADLVTYNDPVDDHKPTHGSLLPLWDVHVACSERPLDVTSICWHPTNPDLFAVSLGCLEAPSGDESSLSSLSPVSSVGGMVCVYSVLDLHAPLAQVNLDVGVMSVAFRPATSSTLSSSSEGLAAGLSDGGLVVVGFGDGRFKNPTIARSRLDHNHLFAVWNVRWKDEVGDQDRHQDGHQDRVAVGNGEADKGFSTTATAATTITTTSHDGLEGHWHIPGEIFDRAHHGKPTPTSPFTNRIVRVGSTIINQPDSTHPFDPTIFLPAATLAAAGPFHLKMVCCRFSSSSSSSTSPTVIAHGTLEGDVAINGTWHQHHTAPVHAIQTNPFDPRYIMAASLDGSLSFWKEKSADTIADNSHNTPPTTMLLDVDVGEPVVDAQWSIKSSTICAAATDTGNIHVYDLSISKEVPICSQHVSNTPLTCIRFASPLAPPAAATANLLAAGTADGRLIWLKLSPNLRIAKNATESDGNEDFWGTNDAATLPDDRDTCLPHTAQLDNLHSVFRY